MRRLWGTGTVQQQADQAGLWDLPETAMCCEEVGEGSACFMSLCPCLMVRSPLCQDPKHSL